MARSVFVLVGFWFMLVSCTQRVICPAYQSAYIYDKDALRKKFSYFNEDDTPKVLTASKTKYLIAEPTTYKKKDRSLRTIPMTHVTPVVPDSLKADASMVEDFSMAERNVNDSTAVIRIDTVSQQPQDSVYVISKEREITVLKYNSMTRKYFVDTIGYNVEQNNYMWYLRDILILPDAKLAQQQNRENASADMGAKGKETKKGFFKNMFKKKDKTEADQEVVENVVPVIEEDYGYDDFEGKTRDSTAVQPSTQQQPTAQKKKGMFSFLKKNKEQPKKPAASPAKKKDEGDDGF